MSCAGVVVGDGRFIFEEETNFTVQKTCFYFDGDGFTVYDSNGGLLFRVESYGSYISDQTEIILMDASGHCLLTVRRKRPSLHQRWEGFVGERTEGQKHIFNVRRSSIMGRTSVTAEVYGSPGEEYQIEGSFAQRTCTIFNAEKKSVAEITRKLDVSANVVMSKEVFSVCLKAGFDGAFVMGLVLVLDQIYGEEFVDDSVDVDSTAMD